MRAQKGIRLHDFSDVEQRAQPERDQSIRINVLVAFPVGKKIVAAQGSAAFAAMPCARMPAQPEIVVTLHAQHVELVKRQLAKALAAADAPQGFIIVAA